MDAVREVKLESQYSSIVEDGKDNYSKSLPDEILSMIFNKLSMRDLISAHLVCRRWYRITEDPQLFLPFFQHYTGMSSIPSLKEGASVCAFVVNSANLERLRRNKVITRRVTWACPEEIKTTYPEFVLRDFPGETFWLYNRGRCQYGVSDGEELDKRKFYFLGRAGNWMFCKKNININEFSIYDLISGKWIVEDFSILPTLSKIKGEDIDKEMAKDIFGFMRYCWKVEDEILIVMRKGHMLVYKVESSKLLYIRHHVSCANITLRAVFGHEGMMQVGRYLIIPVSYNDDP